MPIKKINYQYVVDYFKKQGYPEHAARGIAGNLGHESEFSTTARNPTSKMKGLAQWDTKRRTNLQKFAKNWGLDSNDPDTQLAFVEYELRSDDYKGVRDKLLSSKNSDEASDIFGREYEKFTPRGKQENPAEIEARRYYSANGTRMPKSTKTSTTPATQPSANLSANNAPVNPEVVKELSKAANQGVIPPAEAQTFKPFTPTTTLPKLEADKKLNEPPTASKTGQLLTSTMAKSPDTKKYNAKALSPLKGMDMLPYLSNLYSATVRPPATPSPMLAPPTSLQRVSMDVDRNQLESDYRDTLRNSDLADVATSTRAKLAAKAQKFGQMSKINEVERNANIDISNKEREANLAIDMANRQALYNKQLQDVERQNAILSQQSANFSNFTDKLIAQQGVKDQQDLELKKLDILANYDQFNNINNYMTKMGLTEKKAAGGKLYTAGRFMKTLKPIKTIK